ncbi:MAG TPA: methyltransferase domain-containing protein [Pyrinomonadaceae bacterium]|nr:methyltransferase domain-containing protein [Pyrinomonadaceae bacterium]
MIKPERPRIEIDDLTAVIREIIAAQKHDASNGAIARETAAKATPNFPQLKLQPDFQPRSNQRYHISDLLRYHDRTFVDSAYRAILKRPPDGTEFARDLKRLQSGVFDKIDLLAALRYSNEGKAKGVEVDGLTVPALVRRLGHVPIVGYFVRLAIALVRLPKQLRDQREFDSYLLAQNQQIADFVNIITARFDETTAKLQQLVDEHNTETLKIEPRIAEQIAFEKASMVNRIRVEAEQLQVLIKELQARGQIHDDELYAALEDRFRGSREEIKERCRMYLPYVEPARDGLVIDLGSGRGEWLELLNEAGIKARGVEQNRVSVERCRERGLEVVDDDVFAHLRSLPDESVAAVTGFHIIEHVTIDALLTLLDEVVRVLRPGGLVIFETPNPENVTVGSNFFYLDPTHHHPLPSELMQFLFEARGFERVEVLNLHPWDAGRVAGEGELAERFNGFFFGPMDYAILGWKIRK